jgi:uncharacterized repeat protein (TIGR03803 family)
MKTVQLLALTAAIGASLLPARSAAQTKFDVIYKFGGPPDGAAPQGLVEGPGGVLYGTTAYGGSSGLGTVFQLTPPASPGGKWTETLIYEFTNQNNYGANPLAPLVVGKDGTLYGTTESTVFELQPPSEPGGTWTPTVLYLRGDETYGYGFYRGLAIGPNGEIYGATSQGGFYYCGVVMGLTRPPVPGQWTMSLLFPLPCGAGGSDPQGVILSSDGVLYGAAYYGGTSGQGIVFALTPSPVPGVWTETVLYNFTGGADGGGPSQPLVPAPNIQSVNLTLSLYGTTTAGGANGLGTVFELAAPEAVGGNWTENVLYSFQSGDGEIPDSPLIVNNGLIYGTTATGTTGANSGGSVFELYLNGPSWLENVLHDFSGPAGPSGTLVMDKSGVIYGTTVGGPGPNGLGTVYRIKP